MDQQTDAHSSHDAASHGGDIVELTDAPTVATAGDPDQHPSSCPPLSQPVATSQEPLERSSPGDQRSRGQKRKRTESVSNKDPCIEPVASESQESTRDLNAATKFDQMRRTLKTFMDELPMTSSWGEDWQGDTIDVRKGAVIKFPYFKHVKNLANNRARLPGNPSWTPALRGFTVFDHRLAVVEKNFGTGGLLVRLLTELDDDALSLLHREMYIDGVNGDLYPMLDNFLHVVALDSDGPLVPEPQCFHNGVRLNWRSINGVAPPTNKSSFMYLEEYAEFVEPATLCVVGELAEDEDFWVLKSARDALSDQIDGEDAREIKRRRDDRIRDPIGFALSLVADSLDRIPRDPSPASRGSSQESYSGPYTQRYTHEDRNDGVGSSPYSPLPPHPAGRDYWPGNASQTRRSLFYSWSPGMTPPGFGPEDREGEEGSPPYNQRSPSPVARDYSPGYQLQSPRLCPQISHSVGLDHSPEYRPQTPRRYEDWELGDGSPSYNGSPYDDRQREERSPDY
jgi:hypothetical protein